jgi:NADPH:quinone reductase-like Zn-dependent oxidoreductase
VDTFAVQIAKSFGAGVIGACSTRNVDMVRSPGADHVIDNTKEDFTKGGRRYDLGNFVCGLNAVGSRGPPELLLRTDGRTCAAE